MPHRRSAPGLARWYWSCCRLFLSYAPFLRSFMSWPASTLLHSKSPAIVDAALGASELLRRWRSCRF